MINGKHITASLSVKKIKIKSQQYGSHKEQFKIILLARIR